MVKHDVVIIGAGAFGLSAALTLRGRGLDVAVLDPGPIPHPRAASSDMSKAVRMEYGTDVLYMRLADRAIDGWLAWNQLLDEQVYIDCGVLMLAGGDLSLGGYESDSYALAMREGHDPELLSKDDLRERFPAWANGTYPAAFFHARGGYCRSGPAIAALANCLSQQGVTLYSGEAVNGWIESHGRIKGVQTRGGQRYHAEHTVLAAGVWSEGLLPELVPFVRATAHPLFYLAAPPPPHDRAYRPPAFPVFCADVAHTGWYGFPVDKESGLIKVALHDAGHRVEPDADRGGVTDRRLEQLRTFLARSLPGLKDAEVRDAKHCFYTDTLDGHFLIDRHPGRPGLTVATGGSGHAMKFAPVLGPMVADAVLGEANDELARFRWRDKPSDVPGDAARAR
ncbi:MAG: FAD-dependent oxidoreductase [Planctomycetota bacterium]